MQENEKKSGMKFRGEALSKPFVLIDDGDGLIASPSEWVDVRTKTWQRPGGDAWLRACQANKKLCATWPTYQLAHIFDYQFGETAYRIQSVLP